MNDAPVPGETADVRVDAERDLSTLDREALAKVASLLRDLRYGTILLVVHDGEVVQIEAAEKIRMR